VPNFTVWSDGAARGKKSSGFIGAAGFVVRDESGDLVYAAAKSCGFQNINISEYTGLIMALRWLTHSALTVDAVDFKSDSELMVRQLNGIYRVLDPFIRECYDEAMLWLVGLKSYTIEHVRRELNKEADAMCNRVLDAEKENGTTFVEDDPHGRYSLGRENCKRSASNNGAGQDQGIEGPSSDDVSGHPRLGVRGGAALTVADCAAKDRFAVGRFIQPRQTSDVGGEGDFSRTGTALREV
jgi:ribonuclease HI